MRRIKGLVVIFLVMLFFFFALSLLLPSKVTVLTSIEIGALKEQVSSEINDFEKWKNWYPSINNKNVSVKFRLVKTFLPDDQLRCKMKMVKK